MAKDRIIVKGVPINIEEDFISLTDIAKKSENQEPRYIIANWLKNLNTLEFLEAWEEMHNPNFKRNHMIAFKMKYLQNRNMITPKRWIEETSSIGIISKQGRYGELMRIKILHLAFVIGYLLLFRFM